MSAKKNNKTMDKLNADELRIGNLVGMNLSEFPDNFFLVLEVAHHAMKVSDQWNWETRKTTDHDYFEADDLQPIPITGEWLKNFGFEEIADKDYINGLKYRFVIDEDQREFFEGIGNMKGTLGVLTVCNGNYAARNINYVHELQNLFFCLTGNELKLI